MRLQPEFVPNDAWDAIFTNFTADVGTTLGQYQAALDGDATYLSQLGRSSYDVGDVAVVRDRASQ